LGTTIDVAWRQAQVRQLALFHRPHHDDRAIRRIVARAGLFPNVAAARGMTVSL
jgi:hypothetical protein